MEGREREERRRRSVVVFKGPREGEDEVRLVGGLELDGKTVGAVVSAKGRHSFGPRNRHGGINFEHK